MTTILREIALVSQTANVNMSELAVVGAALQKQVARDLRPVWNIEATVDAFPRLEDVPAGYHPVIVRDDVEATRGVKGVHLDKDNQPFALVQFTDPETWPVFASHEVLEMLVDPSLNTLVAGASIKPDQGRVQYLVEICDPCQDPAFSYRVNGVQVSDFFTPQYFDPAKSFGVRYSFTGSLSGPREIQEGGYLAWLVPETGDWWSGAVFNGELFFTRVGPPNAALPLREFIDSIDRRAPRHEAVPHALAYAKSSSLADVRRASEHRAAALTERIRAMLSAPSPVGSSKESTRAERADSRAADRSATRRLAKSRRESRTDSRRRR